MLTAIGRAYFNADPVKYEKEIAEYDKQAYKANPRSPLSSCSAATVKLPTRNGATQLPTTKTQSSTPRGFLRLM